MQEWRNWAHFRALARFRTLAQHRPHQAHQSSCWVKKAAPTSPSGRSSEAQESWRKLLAHGRHLPLGKLQQLLLSSLLSGVSGWKAAQAVGRLL